MKNIAIFASGSGSNAENIIRYFKDNNEINVAAVFCNNPNAKVIERAKNSEIPCVVFNRETWKNSAFMLPLIQKMEIDFIILAGFLWLVPNFLIENYPNKIINIHPALLPAYGGKGMYGEKVHQEVIKNKEIQSGITIHLINEHYDEGETLAQFKVILEENETAETLATKIHELEMNHFPKVIEDFILGENGSR